MIQLSLSKLIFIGMSFAGMCSAATAYDLNNMPESDLELLTPEMASEYEILVSEVRGNKGKGQSDPVNFTFSFTASAQVASFEKLITHLKIKYLETLGQLGPKVAGGEPVSENEFDFTVAFLVKDSGNQFRQFCGGTLLTPTRILSAAHCNKFPDSQVRVLIGSAGIPDKAGTLEGEIEWMPHKSFRIEKDERGNILDIEHDIAIVKLNRPVQSNSTIRLANNVVKTGSAIVTGWGVTDPMIGETSAWLMKGIVDLWPESSCNSKWGAVFDESSMLCAQKNQTDFCKGDSGGPLLVLSGQSSDSPLVQIGIVSFGALYCAGSNQPPGVYTAVFPYLNWINKNLN